MFNVNVQRLEPVLLCFQDCLVVSPCEIVFGTAIAGLKRTADRLRGRVHQFDYMHVIRQSVKCPTKG